MHSGVGERCWGTEGSAGGIGAAPYPEVVKLEKAQVHPSIRHRLPCPGHIGGRHHISAEPGVQREGVDGGDREDFFPLTAIMVITSLPHSTG
jgi:hypothetical protein